MRLLSFLRDVWRNRQGSRTLPRFLTYTVTFGCNARCIMCDSWKMPSPEDLTLAEVDRIFSQLPRMDAVRLTGGEPFVRRDMVEIAEVVRTRLKPLVLHITSNGFLTQRIVDFCEKRDRRLPLQLLLSMDGMKERHNHIRGHDSAWNMVTKTLTLLAPRQKELRLRLMVNQTIVDAAGAEDYSKLRDFLRPHGVYNNVVLAYDQSATYNLKTEIEVAPTEIGQFTTFGEFSPLQIGHLVSEVEAGLGELPMLERLVKRYYLRGIANRLLHKKGTPNPKCVALNSHLRIFPNGDVPTCQFNTKTAGNLRHQTFQEVWHSAIALEQRAWVTKCPGCWAECEVLPSAIYTGELAWEGRKKTGVPQI
jgi:MoaA/NifB/PqqE/SkfB family radical SAM enzyme